MTEKNELQSTECANLPQQYDSEKLALIKRMYAKGTTNDEFSVFMELARRYELDPFSKQIWAVKYNDQPANIFCGRDGYLAIAHRSGQFNGMESGTRKEGDELVGWCKVHRKDAEYPFFIEVYFNEYEQKAKSGKDTLWQTKPRTMIQKVAEAQALRRAFSISGLYSPEEFDSPDMKEIQNMPSGLCEVCKEIPYDEDISERLKDYIDGKRVCKNCGKKLYDEWKNNHDNEKVIDAEFTEKEKEQEEQKKASFEGNHVSETWEKRKDKAPEPEKPKEAAKKKQEYKCEDCDAEIDKKQATRSQLTTGKPLCEVCQNAFEQDMKKE